MKKTLSLSLMLCLKAISVTHAATVQGYAFLEGQANHSGIQVTLRRTLVTPSLSFLGIMILILLIGMLIYLNTLSRSKSVVISFILLAATIPLLGAFSSNTVLTDASGFYSFQNITEGEYALEASKTCFITQQESDILVQSEPLILETVNLPHAITYNENRIPAHLKQIKIAQIQYNNHSFPHTYTGSLACLTSGNGAGGIGFLDSDFADEIVDGYLFEMDLIGGPDPSGSCWAWECSARPLGYACSGVNSYYINTEYTCPGCTIRSGDTGGATGHSSLPYTFSDDDTHLAQLAMQHFVIAQTWYFNNSSTHTYTDSLACLTSGNGAGRVSFICPELADSEMSNYLYQLEVSEPVSGSSTSWWCSAFPASYGGTTVMTFFIDDSSILRGADIGGITGDASLPSIGYAVDECVVH